MNMIINQRAYTTINPRAASLSSGTNQPVLFELDYLSVMSVEGEQAYTFLQGQLTCDVQTVTEKRMQPGAMCNLKGRVLALLDVVYWSSRGLYLVLPKDLIEPTLASLAKTAMLSRVQVRSEPTIQCVGVQTQGQAVALPLNGVWPSESGAVESSAEYCCYSLDEQVGLMLVPESKAGNFWEQARQSFQISGSLAWHALQLQRLQFELYPETRGVFLPHRIGLHLTNRISFNKGCYKGQEIIARMHYRSTVKHQVKSFVMDIPIEALQSGMLIYERDQAVEVGELIDFCPISATQTLVVVSILTNHTGPFRIGMPHLIK